MKTLIAILITGISMPVLVMGQERIDRRDQARSAFLATPRGIYNHYCAHCHGEDGTGMGRLWAMELSPAPADLTALSKDKAYVLEVIREGSSVHGKSNLCPPWGRTLSPENVERLARFVVSLGGEETRLPVAPGVRNGPSGGSFPWWLLALLLGEVLVFWRLLPKTGPRRFFGGQK